MIETSKYVLLIFLLIYLILNVLGIIRLIKYYRDDRKKMRLNLILIFLIPIFWSLLVIIFTSEPKKSKRYVESIAKTVRTYALLVFLFAFIFYSSPHASLTNYTYALLMSFKNMVAMTDKSMTDINPLIDFLNIIQTTFGILIIGIFGYILGNKIRNNQ